MPFGKASIRSSFVLNFQWIAIGDTNKSKLAGLAVVKKWNLIFRLLTKSGTFQMKGKLGRMTEFLLPKNPLFFFFLIKKYTFIWKEKLCHLAKFHFMNCGKISLKISCFCQQLFHHEVKKWDNELLKGMLAWLLYSLVNFQE